MKEISNKQVIIKCHDEKAMTWDTLDLKLMKTVDNYFDCTREYSNLECYEDTDLVALYEKINNDWERVKTSINIMIKKDLYEIASKKKGFCMIIEPIFKGEEVEI